MERARDTGLGVAAAVVIAWIWQTAFPETAMPQEVAAALGAIVGPLIEDLRKIRRRLLGKWLDAEPASE